MDVSMPNLDGLEATRILRQRGYTTPIIAMTAHALKGDRDYAFQIGISGYITKPVRPDALRGELAKWLSPASAAPQPNSDSAKEPRISTARTVPQPCSASSRRLWPRVLKPPVSGMRRGHLHSNCGTLANRSCVAADKNTASVGTPFFDAVDGIG
ncbi:MAG: response regulator [Kamptonema sp. SIO1D9]|nr:response regulator [Kamptonema sp. SIO1D9]